MKVTLTKQKTFELEPFGKFKIKFLKKTTNISPKTIPVSELSMYVEDAYPLGDFEDEFVMLMKKHKTDIFSDGTYNGFYTRGSQGMTRVSHHKLRMYRDDINGFKDLIDY